MPSPDTTAEGRDETRRSAGGPAEVAAEVAAGPGGRRTLGRFRLGRVLGRGGMGTVYAAFDPTLRRHVALKVPRFDAADDRGTRARFLREARAAAAVRHPHLVEVYEAGCDDGPDGRACYLASQLCDGPNLADWLRDRAAGPLPPRFAAALVAPLAAAVHRCHLAGIVHRDLKPANILLDAAPPAGAPGGELSADPPGAGPLPFVPKISDFGVARALEESPAATTASRVVGTPLYMAPEQAAGRTGDVGPATDVFALGAILYELLTGRPPFAGRTTLELLRRIEADDPAPVRRLRPDVPAPLAAIVETCLRKRPADRYPAAAALAADLENWRAGRPIVARRQTARDRLAAWLRRPQRVRDAATAALLCNGCVAAALATLATLAALGWDSPLPANSGMAGEAGALAAAHALLTAAAWRALAGARWAWRVCFAASAAVWAVCLNGALGGRLALGVYRDLPAAKFLMTVALGVVFTAQLATFLLSARADPLPPPGRGNGASSGF